MSVVFTANTEGTDGAAATAAATGYSSLTLDPGSTITYSAAHKIEGATALRFATAADPSGTVATAAQTGLNVTTRRYLRRYVRCLGNPPQTVCTLTRARNGSTTLAQVLIGTDGKLQLRDRNTTPAAWTSTGSFGDGAPFRYTLFLDVAAKQMRLDVYRGADLYGTAPTETSGLLPWTGAAITTVVDGIGTGQLSAAYSVVMDAIVDDDAADPGPITAVAPGALSADAGADQTVEQWETVTLAGADSGTVTSRVWAQTGGPAVTLSGSGATCAFEAPGVIAGATLTFAYTVTDGTGANATDSMTVTVLPVTERAVVGGVEVPLRVTEVSGTPVSSPPVEPCPTPGVPTPPPRLGHEWTMWSRTPAYGLDLALPIVSAKFVVRHMGVSTATVQTPFTPQRWTSLQPSCGIVLYRDGRQEFTGRLTARQVDWDAENGRAVIKVEAKGDEVLLADRRVFPDPLRAADDQTVNDYWIYTGAASSAMLQLISDQAGATCRGTRQIPGLALGADPGVGLSRKWSALFLPVLDQLALMSVASGANLGLRMTSSAGTLTAALTVPRNLTGAVRFSADLSNLVGFSYREEAPSITRAVAAGQGDLHLRLRKLAITTDPLALQWQREIWSYIDRRDTADAAELLQAAQDALADGGPTVSLAVTLTDSQAATYGRDWGRGDKISIYVGLPGQTKVVSVADVVREIAFEVTADGKERITPAIGSYDAKAVLPTPTQRQLAAVGAGLSGLIARK